ncbi:hypothetical protein D3C77_556980 [compost metagenome]
MESTAANTFCALLWLLMSIPPALPPVKMVDTPTVVITLPAGPDTTSIVVAAAVAIPEILKPSAWDKLKLMVWLASAPTWKVPPKEPSSSLVPAKVVALEIRLTSAPS